MNWKISLFLVSCLFLVPLNLPADILDDIQKQYMQYDDFTVSFSQGTYQIIVNKKIHFVGRVFYKRDLGVRMDVYTPERQVIILKDQTVIIHLPDKGTTSTQEIPKEIVTQNILGFFSGLHSIEEEYDIDDTGENLILYPKKGIGHIKLWVDDRKLLSRIQLQDATGNQSDIQLSAYKFNTGLTDLLFDPNWAPGDDLKGAGNQIQPEIPNTDKK